VLVEHAKIFQYLLAASRGYFFLFQPIEMGFFLSQHKKQIFSYLAEKYSFCLFPYMLKELTLHISAEHRVLAQSLMPLTVQ
jgi:hypothetical protein